MSSGNGAPVLAWRYMGSPYAFVLFDWLKQSSVKTFTLRIDWYGSSGSVPIVSYQGKR